MTVTNGYITLANLKTYLKIDDSVEDSLLENIIESASRSIDKIANRRFYIDSTASARLFQNRTYYTCITDDIASTTGLVVKTAPDSSGVYQQTLAYGTDYILNPYNAASLNRPWTSIVLVGSNSFSLPTNLRPQIEVTAKWGWPVVPDDIEQATYILSADLYKRKDSIGGVLGLSELGAIRMSPLGRDIAAIVRAYRREFFA